MLWLLFLIAFIIFVVGLVMWWPTRKKSYPNRVDGPVVFGICCMTAVGVAIIIMTMTTTSSQVDAGNSIDEVKQQRKEIVAYKARVEDNIRDSLAEYPELEGKIIKDIDPIILINYPKLQSSKTITKEFEALQRVNDKILTNKNKQFSLEKKIKNIDQNPLYWGLDWS